MGAYEVGEIIGGSLSTIMLCWIGYSLAKWLTKRKKLKKDKNERRNINIQKV